MLPSGLVLHNWPCGFQDFQLLMEGLVLVTHGGGAGTDIAVMVFLMIVIKPDSLFT